MSTGPAFWLIVTVGGAVLLGVALAYSPYAAQEPRQKSFVIAKKGPVTLSVKRGSLSLPIFAQQGRAHIRGDRPRWRSASLCVFDLANR